MNKDELDMVLAVVKSSLKPYLGKFSSNERLPEEGVPKKQILKEICEMREVERHTWQEGYVSGAVYHGDPEWMNFLNEVYALNAEINPLHADLWPRATRFEAEVVAMTADILGKNNSPTKNTDGGVVGFVTSGGTDSILHAVRCARDHAQKERGVTNPTIVMPTSAHAAFLKAAQYFCLEPIRVAVDDQGRAVPREMEAAIDERTAILVGSAPSFPWGVIDPIEELSELGHARGIWFHTDCCLGGFLLPFASQLGYDIPKFDFALKGVTSISCDTHKYGYATKGSSVLLFRNKDLRHYSYFKVTDWPGGLYNSPTMAGSRPGALLATAWAAMLAMGKNGYLEATEKIVATTKKLREGISGIKELRLLGNSVLVTAFTSDAFDIYALGDLMSEKGWNIGGLQLPPALHMGVTLRTAQPGVATKFLTDLADSVKKLNSEPGRQSVMAPIYGVGKHIDTEVSLDDILVGYLDVQYDTR